jgi:flagellar hook assembly protein FlgD
LRVNDKVKLTLESDAITKIVATTTQESSGKLTGVISSINTAYGVISVTADGSATSTNIFCKDSTTVFKDADGKDMKMKELKLGQTVEVRGTISNGVFAAKFIIVEN